MKLVRIQNAALLEKEEQRSTMRDSNNGCNSKPHITVFKNILYVIR